MDCFSHVNRLTLVTLLTARTTLAQEDSSGFVDSACEGNFLRTFVNVSLLQGHYWNVSVEAQQVGFLGTNLCVVHQPHSWDGDALSINTLDRSQALHLLTPRFATQCGYTFHTRYDGTLTLQATLTSCHVYQQDSEHVLKMLWVFHDKNDLGNVTIPYTISCNTKYVWAQREILCMENFKEVSIKRSTPNIPDVEVQQDDFDIDEIMTADQIWKIFFKLHNGSRFEASIPQAFQMGYAVNTSNSRVVFRSPYFTDESYSMMIGNTLVDVVKPLVYYADRWSAFILDMTTACPIQLPTCMNQTIVWTLPKILQPLVLHLANVKYLETSVWVDLQKVAVPTLIQRGYLLTQTNTTTSLSVPWGAEGGFNESCWVNWHFGTEYIIDLQIQYVWTDDIWDLTKITITTKGSCPCQEIRLQDDVCGQGGFLFMMGPFLTGVSVVNLTVGARPFTVCGQATGGIVLLQSAQDPCGSPESLVYRLQRQPITWSANAFYFVLQVPFNAALVQAEYVVGTIMHLYTLAVELVLIDTEEQYYVTRVQQTCSSYDVVLPLAYGSCTDNSLNLMVQPGSMASTMLLFVGDTWLSSEAIDQMGYSFYRNATYFSISMPPDAKGVTIEEVSASSVTYTFHLRLVDMFTNETDFNLTVSCQFPNTNVIACFPNGTVALAAPKGQTKPEVDLRRLALRDPSCGPVYVNTTKAYFVFTVATCGTTRKIEGDFLVYENEVTLQKELLPDVNPVITRDTDYKLKIICRYGMNDTLMISNVVEAHQPPTAEESLTPVPIVMKISRSGGSLLLQLDVRLFKDAAYTSYYLDEEYPVVSFLQEPLYFEVRLLGLEDNSIEMFLEDCWATNQPASDGQPRWDIIVNSCANSKDNYQTIFHPVPNDSSVAFPQNVKRFEVKTFVFESDLVNELQGQLFFHCSVVICDAVDFDDICQMPCVPNRKRVARSSRHGLTYGMVSSGAVRIYTPRGRSDDARVNPLQGPGSRLSASRALPPPPLLLLYSLIVVAVLALAAVCVRRLARVRHRSLSLS